MSNAYFKSKVVIIFMYIKSIKRSLYGWDGVAWLSWGAVDPPTRVRISVPAPTF